MKKGTLVAVRFLDHTQHTTREGNDQWNKPVACEYVGYVIEDRKEYLVLSSWLSDSIDSVESDFCTIVKHPGMQIRRLRPPRFKA